MMKNRLINAVNFLMVAMLLSGASIVTAQVRPYRVSDTQVRSVISRIETKTDAFQRSINSSLDRSRVNNTNREDDILTYISDFEDATDRLSQTVGNRGTVYNNEVNDVLSRATYIDQFMTRNRLAAATERQWQSLRTDLNMLANYYNVGTWNWNQTLPAYPGRGYPTSGGFPVGGGRGIDARLTGTFRLNRSASDNVSAAVGRVINVYGTSQRPNMRNNLERRLASPDMIAIEKNGQSIVMASDLSPQVSFNADGIARSETNNRGRTITTTVTADRNGLNISAIGDRSNDFYVTFTPVGNDRLRVSRKLYLENRNETITVNSVYDKIDTVARWSSVNSGGVNTGNAGNLNNYYIPNGTRLVATLRNSINTRDTQVGDRFQMEVTSPSIYRGAVIEGRVSNVERSGRVSGRANFALDFDSIRMRDGRSYRFEGLIDSVRTPNGDTVSINNEGVIRDNNQTTKTVTRAGIGAAIGAIIGAIAGGGSGAAIGAGVGAGAGAGSVLIQGRDNLDLGTGTEFNITSSSPTNVGYYRQ
jgi:hypothetical protein